MWPPCASFGTVATLMVLYGFYAHIRDLFSGRSGNMDDRITAADEAWAAQASTIPIPVLAEICPVHSDMYAIEGVHMSLFEILGMSPSSIDPHEFGKDNAAHKTFKDIVIAHHRTKMRDAIAGRQLLSACYYANVRDDDDSPDKGAGKAHSSSSDGNESGDESSSPHDYLCKSSDVDIAVRRNAFLNLVASTLIQKSCIYLRFSGQLLRRIEDARMAVATQERIIADLTREQDSSGGFSGSGSSSSRHVFSQIQAKLDIAQIRRDAAREELSRLRVVDGLVIEDLCAKVQDTGGNAGEKSGSALTLLFAILVGILMLASWKRRHCRIPASHLSSDPKPRPASRAEKCPEEGEDEDTEGVHVKRKKRSTDKYVPKEEETGNEDEDEEEEDCDVVPRTSPASREYQRKGKKNAESRGRRTTRSSSRR